MTDKERLEEIMDKIAYVRDEYLDDKVVSEYYGHDITSEIVGCPISALSYTGDYIELLQKRVQELEELSEHHLKMLKYCSDARKKYYGVIKTLYEFDGDVQEHSALADMLCSEALEESQC